MVERGPWDVSLGDSRRRRCTALQDGSRVAPRTARDEYRKVIQRALDDLKKFKPALVAVSAGFDAYARDPLAQETLEAEDFYWIGESLRKLEIPVFSVLEGGYSRELPELVLAYMKGIRR